MLKNMLLLLEHIGITISVQACSKNMIGWLVDMGGAMYIDR